MQLSFHHPIHVSYCTNVHAAETWSEMFANLKRWTLPIRDRVAGGKPFGIGLWLSDAASREIENEARLAQFQDFLAAENCYVFTLNGFPFGRFHGARVKEQVYAPDWRTAERLEYTCRLARILARLLPAGARGSISTVPGSFKEWMTDAADPAAIARNLADCAIFLERLAEETGREISLGLEPEPLAFIENVDESVSFFENQLRPLGAARLVGSAGISQAEARRALDARLGLCYDCCHMAVEFERAEEDLEKLRRAGISIVKFHISSALRLAPSAEALAELARFQDGVYLHQVIGLGANGARSRWKDIDLALADRASLEAQRELRVHCHVPLDMPPHRGLASTSDHIDATLRALSASDPTDHFELETYTWDVLPPDAKRADLVEDIAGEFEWFKGRLDAIKREPRR